VADNDYEHYWKVVRPNRRVSPPAPSATPAPPATPAPIDRNLIGSAPGFGFDHDAFIRNHDLPNRQAEPLRIEHLTNLDQLLGAEQLQNIGRVLRPSTPDADLQRQIILRGQLWISEIRRGYPNVSDETNQILVGIARVLMDILVEYAQLPDATLDGADALIQENLAPILNNQPTPAVAQRVNPSTFSQSMRRHLGLGLSTEELLTRVMNEIGPGTPQQTQGSILPTFAEMRQVVQEGLWNNQPTPEEAQPRRFHASWMTPALDNSPQQLTNLVRAFTALGIPVDVSLELQDDSLANSVLELVIDNQTIRIESGSGSSFVRVFDRINRL
jgi:hypothetical protein